MQCTSCKNSIFYCQYCGKEIEECKKAEGEEEATITEGDNVKGCVAAMTLPLLIIGIILLFL